MANDYALLKELYETERKSEHRTFARDHSFEEWAYNRNRIANADRGPCEVVRGRENEEMVRS